MGCASSTAGKPDHKKVQAPADQTANDDEYGDEEDFQPLTQEEVNARIQHSDGTLSQELASVGITAKYAYLSQRGYYPEDLYKANQDAFLVVPEFNGNPNSIFFGVFDGHGVDGDACSGFVRDNFEVALKEQMAKYPEDFERAYKETYVSINNTMHDEPFDDTMSGTTAISVFMKDNEISVANIGDSRAIIGERKGKRIIAYSLSIDQTPYRQDERERVKGCGAVVMSCDQLEGNVPFHENWGINLGEELDNDGDPPRVWAQGKTFPGCAFTRSIGDSVAEQIGVFAEPELLAKELTPEDEFIVLASDGVFEFLTNQSVADMVMKFEDPLEACRAVVAESYRLWLQYEVRTDDITIIIVVPEGVGQKERPIASDESDGSMRARSSARRKSSRRESRRGSAEGIMIGLDVVARGGGENRPVRRGLSKEKRNIIMASMANNQAEDEDYKPEIVPKSADEIERIQRAVRVNFMFQHLNDKQAEQVYGVMKPVPVKANEVVIKQGDPGDWFYVVDSGEYSVSVQQDNAEVEILRYDTKGGTNPCFGELALMYSKPRAATVRAVQDGVLWAMDRRSFRSILMKSSSTTLTRTLRSVDVLKSLSIGQLQRLQDILTVVDFEDGEYVIRQGEYSDTFYVIMEGKAKCTKKEDPDDPHELPTELMQLSEGQYFGERALLMDAPRAANVIACGRLKCLFISRDAFEEVLGPLQGIIDEDRKWREKIAVVKQLQQESEGLNQCSLPDFTVQGVVNRMDCGVMLLCQHNSSGREYTIKTVSKQQVVDSGQESRIISEKTIFGTLCTPSPFIPLALATFTDPACLYTVMKARAACELHTLMSEPFTEDVARFYSANVLLALEALHSDSIAYRNLSPEFLMLDQRGYIQLMDLRFAKKVEGQTHTLCGTPEYLSPEQISGQGHSLPVDYWGLGVLIFEMVTGDTPFADKDSNSELDTYNKITKHQYRSLKIPSSFSENLELLIEELLHPDPMKRIGCRGAGPEEVRQHPWFIGIDFVELANGTTKGPHADITRKIVDNAIEASSHQDQADDDSFVMPDSKPYTGDSKWFDDFNMLFTPRT